MKAEVSIPVALATGGVVYGIYQVALPSIADARTVPMGSPGDMHLAGAEKTAFWGAVIVAGAVSLVAKDPVPFWLGGGLAVALSWMHRTARVIDPTTGRVPASPGLIGARYTAEATL